MWEGVGLLLISLMSWQLFDEVFSTEKLLAIAALMTGMILMNVGEKLSERAERTEHADDKSQDNQTELSSQKELNRLNMHNGLRLHG